MRKKYITRSPSQTRKLGEKLAKEVLRLRKDKAIVVALEGELGGGKTTFLQGFAKGLKIKKQILSPTFVVLKRFKISNSNFKNFYHIDCWRIQKPKEILKLGFKKILSDSRNIIAIEWAEKIKEILPKNRINLKFKILAPKAREIIVK
jgi:tRNA threonylcarbamoyladenosine biosynthesis protein TsaE